ncbi:MAG TPA: hypothetical protein VFB14_28350 [Bryobacteraceae bacterium]|nr:hypothetical protein [Bryobacteraceae bacterium]
MRERPHADDWASQTADLWRDCAGRSVPNARTYSPTEQRENEEAYDEALQTVEADIERADEPGTRDRLIASFARFSAKALGLDQESIDLLTSQFLPAGTQLAQWARRFDADLSMASIIQATRNAWTACGLQPLLGVPMKLTPSILGYSLLYPYTDNYLDDESISAEAKLWFSRRFRDRLAGQPLPPENDRERAVWALIALVESQYAREFYPQVFDCLLAIHGAQEQSIGQGSLGEADCLRISCRKGGTSVLADACLVRGSLDAMESRFAFEWGVLLQLGDDLQDLHDDMRRGSATLFSRAAASCKPLDGLTVQLLNFSARVGERMDELPHGSASFKELLKMSWRSLIIRAVADSHEFFSPWFLREAEQCSPFRFEFLRARSKRLANQEGLYAGLFNKFIEAPDHPQYSLEVT